VRLRAACLCRWLSVRARVPPAAAADGRRCAGKYGAYCWSICQFYKAYHARTVGLDGIFLHDPTALAAVLAPQAFGWTDGAVRVACDGLSRGKTLMDAGTKKCGPRRLRRRASVVPH
jgi:inosine-uridine nucleoside N-ribohydrolase